MDRANYWKLYNRSMGCKWWRWNRFWRRSWRWFKTFSKSLRRSWKICKNNNYINTRNCYLYISWTRGTRAGTKCGGGGGGTFVTKAKGTGAAISDILVIAGGGGGGGRGYMTGVGQSPEINARGVGANGGFSYDDVIPILKLVQEELGEVVVSMIQRVLEEPRVQLVEVDLSVMVHLVMETEAQTMENLLGMEGKEVGVVYMVIILGGSVEEEENTQ